MSEHGLRLEYTLVVRAGNGEVPVNISDVISLPMALRSSHIRPSATSFQKLFEAGVQEPLYVEIIAFLHRVRQEQLEKEDTAIPGVFVKNGKETQPMSMIDPALIEKRAVEEVPVFPGWAKKAAA